MRDKTVTAFLHWAFGLKNVIVSCLIHANSFYNENKSIVYWTKERFLKKKNFKWLKDT